jgi:hypothetical protein
MLGITEVFNSVRHSVFKRMQHFGNWICFAKVGGTYSARSVTPLPPFHLRTETDPVSETLCSLEYRKMDRVQKLSNSECYMSSSERFRKDLYDLFFSRNVIRKGCLRKR